MKVLIIDDDETMIGIWSTVLKKESIEVLTAGSGKLGIELAQKNIPDFVLLDQIITDMKGNDVLKQLKSNPTTAGIPVALVSNYSEPEMMHDAIESGAIDYILKYQIDPSDLANKIKTLLHGTKSLNAPQSMPADPSTGQPMTPPAQPIPQPQIFQPQVVQPIQTNPTDPTVAQTPVAPAASASNAAQANATVPQPVVIDPSASSGQGPTKPTQ